MEHPPPGDEPLHSRPSPAPRRQGFLRGQPLVQTASHVHIVQGARCLPRPNLCPHANHVFSLSQSVKLDGYQVVEAFLSRFPSTCRTHIRSLFVSMRPQELTQEYDCAASQTDLLVILLSTCTMIQSLTLYLFGSPQKHIVPPFARLIHLTSLFIGTVAPEQLMPL